MNSNFWEIWRIFNHFSSSTWNTLSHTLIKPYLNNTLTLKTNTIEIQKYYHLFILVFVCLHHILQYPSNIFWKRLSLTIEFYTHSQTSLWTIWINRKNYSKKWMLIFAIKHQLQYWFKKFNRKITNLWFQ